MDHSPPLSLATLAGHGPWLLPLVALLVVVLAFCVRKLRESARVDRINRRRARALEARAEAYATEPDTRPLAEALQLYRQRQRTERPLLDRLFRRPKTVEQAVKDRLAASPSGTPAAR